MKIDVMERNREIEKREFQYLCVLFYYKWTLFIEKYKNMKKQEYGSMGQIAGPMAYEHPHWYS